MGVYPAPTQPVLDDGRRRPSEQDQKALEAFAAIYAAGGGGGEAVEDIEAVRWKKVLWNAAWGGLSTLARQPVSTLLLDETLHYSVGVVRRTMLEIVYVARACGLNETRFPMAAVDNAVNITLSTSSVPGVQDPAKGGNLAPAFKPSILLDLENGRPMELEVIIGNIVRQARRHNVDTPRLDLILATLKLNQIHAIRAAKERDRGQGQQSGDAVTTFSQLKATSRGNWPAGAPVSQNPHTYL
jgi:2-dehydropantoate 2-reductase